MNHLVLVSQYYPPEGAGIIVQAIANYQASLGRDVTIITGTPHYPHGERMPGYRRLPRNIAREGENIRVVRLAEYCYHGRSPIRRTLNYLSFILMTLFTFRILRSADLIYVYGSPVTAGLVPKALKKAATPVVVHVQDLWPESVVQTGMLKGPLRSAVSKVTRLVSDYVYNVEKLIVSSPGMMDALRRRSALADVAFDFIANWADEERERRKCYSSSRPGFHLVYAGNLGEAQALERVILGIGLARAQGCDVELTLYGTGSALERLQHLAAEVGTDFIRFMGRVDPAEVDQALQRADAALVSLADEELFKITIPGKLQQLMYFGIPIIGCVDGDAARFIKESGCGVVTGHTPNAIADAIVDFAARDRRAAGHACQAYYDENFSREIALTRIEASFASVLHG